MATINPRDNTISDEVVQKFQSFSTPLLSDVLSDDNRTMVSGIKPVYESAVMTGRALTVDAQPKDNLIIHKAVSLSESMDILVIDADKFEEAGIFGELMSINAQNNGVAGVVVDGAVRDVTEIKELDFPVFSRSVSPKGSSKKLPGSINIPISCGGVVINPGDLIIGDQNGVVSVPKSDVVDICEKAEEKKAAEERLRNGGDVSSQFEDTFTELLPKDPN